MDIQEIEVVIGKNGQVTLHVSGVQGNACLPLTADMEQALGGLLLNRQMTSEAAALPDNTPANALQDQSKVKHRRR
jgi:hypothetical protein